MFFWWGPGWVAGLISTLFWIGVIVVAVLLLRHEIPHLQHRFGEPAALRLLEERYARGEISRDEFLERREVLLQPLIPPQTTPPPPAAGGSGNEQPSGTGPTQPIPPSSSST